THAETEHGLTPVDMRTAFNRHSAERVPFTAQTRMSGIEWGGRSIRKGAADAVRRWAEEQGGGSPEGLAAVVDGIAVHGGTPLVVAEGPRILGVIHLKDTIKEGMVKPLPNLRTMATGP